MISDLAPVIVIALACMAAVGTLLWRKGVVKVGWIRSPKDKAVLRLAGRLPLAPQSAAFLLEVEGDRWLVVTSQSAIALRQIGTESSSARFEQAVREAQSC